MESKADTEILRLWQQQASEDQMMPLDEIRTKAERLDTKTRRWRVVTAALLIVLLIKGALEVWAQTETLERAGDLLLMAALVYVAYRYRKLRLAAPPVALGRTNCREFYGADTLHDGLPIQCKTCIPPRLARAYDLAGKVDEAIAQFERYLTSTYPFRGRDTDSQFLAGIYKRLGELYEAKRDREKAATNYTRFIELWKDADPELQPKVAEARARLARLTAEERR